MTRMISDVDHAAEEGGERDRATMPTTAPRRHHREADEQRDARAIDQAREHVATDVIGAEQERAGAAFLPDRRQRGSSRNCSIGECGARSRREHARSGSGARRRRGRARRRGSPRNRCQNSRSGPRLGGRRLRGATSAGIAADPRVDDAVEQIDAADSRSMTMPAISRMPPCSTGIVAPADRIDQPVADARPGEDRLGEDGAGEQRADLQADHGDHGDQRVAQRMDADDAERATGPWRGRCAHSPRPAPRASPSASCARSPRAGWCRARWSAGSGGAAPIEKAPSWPESRLSISMKPVTGSKK